MEKIYFGKVDYAGYEYNSVALTSAKAMSLLKKSLKLNRMRVLIACEYSGRVREAFRKRGHYALSCDLLPSDIPGNHYQGDVLDVLSDGWDLMIGHPPCTFMSNSGAKHLYIGMKKENGINPERWAQMEKATEFFNRLWSAPIGKICLENPIMVGHARKLIKAGMPQVIQPHMFGHLEVKATCLWLKNLPPLVKTNDVKKETMALPYGERAKVHHASPGPNRWKFRSTTYQGIANAMAEQWGGRQF